MYNTSNTEGVRNIHRTFCYFTYFDRFRSKITRIELFVLYCYACTKIFLTMHCIFISIDCLT